MATSPPRDLSGRELFVEGDLVPRLGLLAEVLGKHRQAYTESVGIVLLLRDDGIGLFFLGGKILGYYD